MRNYAGSRSIAVSSALALAISACAGGPAPTTDEASQAPPDSSQSVAPTAGGASGDCDEFTMVSYGGATGEPHRFFLADPFEEEWGASVELVPSSGPEVLAQIEAAAGDPPYDTIPLDVGPQIEWSQRGVLEETPSVDDVPNLADVYTEYMDDTYGYGVPATYSVIGIAYNPEVVTDPPTSWADLWDPKYEGLVGIPTPVSSLGRGFVWMAGRLNGGDESSIDPAFEQLEALRPNLSVIAANPPALATLFERGEIAIAPLWNNNTAALKATGYPVEWIAPEDGAIVVQSTMNIVTGAPCQDMLHDYLNRVLSVEYQEQAAAAPYYFGPTNRNVEVPEESRAFLPSTPEEVEQLLHIDWAAWDQHLDDILDRFNRAFGEGIE